MVLDGETDMAPPVAEECSGDFPSERVGGTQDRQLGSGDGEPLAGGEYDGWERDQAEEGTEEGGYRSGMPGKAPAVRGLRAAPA